MLTVRQTTIRRRRIMAAMFITIMSLNTGSCWSYEVKVEVLDPTMVGKPNVVVAFYPDNNNFDTPESSITGVMNQVNKQFSPHTLVIQKGTKVAFPNSDEVQHHVYSFSPARVFELKLYNELELEPLLFDKAGIVEIGCNIHDWMLGYIYVVDTPYYTQTMGAGKSTIELPSGEYEVKVWHPSMQDTDIEASYALNVNTNTNFTINLKQALGDSYDQYEDGISSY